MCGGHPEIHSTKEQLLEQSGKAGRSCYQIAKGIHNAADKLAYKCVMTT